jgi:hypothetical protein
LTSNLWLKCKNYRKELTTVNVRECNLTSDLCLKCRNYRKELTTVNVRECNDVKLHSLTLTVVNSFL